jgi:hypothetical protein
MSDTAWLLINLVLKCWLNRRWYHGLRLWGWRFWHKALDRSGRT